MAAIATFALNAGAWFRRGRLLMVSPDSRGTACPLSGRNSTYRPVQISGTGSDTLTHSCPIQAGAESNHRHDYFWLLAPIPLSDGGVGLGGAHASRAVVVRLVD